MGLFIWLDFILFTLLFLLSCYVFFTVTITYLHKVYFVFQFFMMMWPLCQFATDVTKNSQLQLLYVKLSFVCLALLGGGWLMLTTFLTGRAHSVSRRNLGIFFGPAVIASIGIIANPYYAFVAPVDGGYVHRTYGVWFWIVVCVLLGYLFTSLYLMYRAILSTKTVSVIKKQVHVALLGIYVLALFAVSDLMINVVLRHWFPIVPGLTSFGIFLSDIFFVYSIQRYNALDLVKIAHDDMINTIPYGIVVLDEYEMVVEVNNAFRALISIPVGAPFSIERFLSSVELNEERTSVLQRYTHYEEIVLEFERMLDGVRNHYTLQSFPIEGPGRIPVGRTITIQDITRMRHLVNEVNGQNEALQEQNRSLMELSHELSVLNQKLQDMALTDSLTNCYNRRYLMQQLSHEVMTSIHYQIPFSLILLDIDHFKAVNDDYGHVIGDEVLCQTVETVKQSLREVDILARYGGEEFMIYLPHTQQQTAQTVAEQLRMSVESKHMICGEGTATISITISVGVLSVLHHDGVGMSGQPQEYLTELFKTVDKALYRAKQNGRNRVEYIDATHLVSER